MKGEVGIENKDSKWRLRLPRSVAKDSARYITTRLDATPENLRKAQIKAWEIEEDIKTGSFDTTLSKYQFVVQQGRVDKVPSLKELWLAYCEFKRSQVCITTFAKEYKKYTNHIEALPSHDLNQAVLIRDYLLATRSPLVVKRILMYLSACCNWAVRSGSIKTNPFAYMTSEIHLSKDNAREISPFTVEERDAIIKAFQQHPSHCHYALFVRFLFLTGCRTGEAIALQWKHITRDCSYITFCESYDSSLKIRKTTKTGRSRRFPCNSVLQELLLSLKPTLDDYEPTNLVFKSRTGLPINNVCFINQVWKGSITRKQTYKGIVTELVKEGKVQRYRPQYNTRHTFITQALEAGITVPQVAMLVGNSPEVILRHYAGSLLRFDIPVF